MEMAQRREVHEQLLAEVELSARGNREHQLLLLLWQRVLASPFMGKQWLLHRFEWYVREGWTHLGVGDAVFVDEAGRCALVLELKLMHEVRCGQLGDLGMPPMQSMLQFTWHKHAQPAQTAMCTASASASSAAATTACPSLAPACMCRTLDTPRRWHAQKHALK